VPTTQGDLVETLARVPKHSKVYFTDVDGGDYCHMLTMVQRTPLPELRAKVCRRAGRVRQACAADLDPYSFGKISRVAAGLLLALLRHSVEILKPFSIDQERRRVLKVTLGSFRRFPRAERWHPGR
jgi:hypothetical protein